MKQFFWLFGSRPTVIADRTTAGDKYDLKRQDFGTA
jgi:hypothetical protein